MTDRRKKMEGADILRLLRDEPWDSVRTARSPGSTLYDGILFEVAGRELYITGTDQIMHDGYDTFSLMIVDRTNKNWSPFLRFGTEENVRVLDLMKIWHSRSVQYLFQPPRRLQFYTDCTLDKIVGAEKNILMRCSALGICSKEYGDARMLITTEQMNISIWIEDEYAAHLEPYFREYVPDQF